MKKTLPFYLINLSNLHAFKSAGSNSIHSIFKEILQSKNNSLSFLLKNGKENNYNKLETSSYLNDFFKLSNKLHIKPNQIVYTHEYLNTKIESYNNLKNGLLMLCGPEEKILNLAKENNYRHYITMDEYCQLFPGLVPISKRSKDGIIPAKEKFLARVPEFKDRSFDYPFQINSVFFLDNVTDWEEYTQVITDLLSTSDGNIAHKFPAKPIDNHIPIYFSSSENYSYDEKGEKILGLGSLKEAFLACYELIYKKKLIFNELEPKSPEESIIEFVGMALNLS